MNQEPEIPRPVREIPRGPLWISLLTPPVVVFLGNMAVLMVGGGASTVSLCIPPIMFFVILGFTIRFSHLVSERYRGSSVVFLKIGYFLGQTIVCLAVWFGSCLLSFSLF